MAKKGLKKPSSTTKPSYQEQLHAISARLSVSKEVHQQTKQPEIRVSLERFRLQQLSTVKPPKCDSAVETWGVRSLRSYMLDFENHSRALEASLNSLLVNVCANIFDEAEFDTFFESLRVMHIYANYVENFHGDKWRSARNTQVSRDIEAFCFACILDAKEDMTPANQTRFTSFLENRIAKRIAKRFEESQADPRSVYAMPG